ncbi:MAG: purple acid phosphatase family protein [Desulfobaccales bacterium]
MPVKDPAHEGLKSTNVGIRNLIDIGQIYAAVKDGEDQGLRLDLTGITTLTDGSKIDPGKIYGTIYVGPYPLEGKFSDYDMKRFRKDSAINGGTGTLKLAYLLNPPHNSEGWTDAGVVALRVALVLETPNQDRQLGVYDTFVRFKKIGNKFIKRPVIIEGPLVHLVRSDDCGRFLISFKTGEEVVGKVLLEDGREFADLGPTRRHEIVVTGLKPQKTYRYRVALDDYQTRWYQVHTAPRPGEGSVTFAFMGDSREGVGGGEQNFMGLNLEAMKYAMRFAYRQRADLLLMAGDLANGYTPSLEDFHTQLNAWKQAASDFWHERPVYVAMGNHESLLKKFEDGKKEVLEMDNWPYAEVSSEAVFAEEFLNPENGPTPADPRRPPYRRNVYAFQYGPVRFIAINNAYWVNWLNDSWVGVKRYGGCPEGYIMEDQFDWIKREVARAEKDPTVQYIILFAHEPLLPNSGHVQDSMWYLGNNQVRAYVVNGNGAPTAAGPGIIEMRNKLIKLACQSKKVAAVLGSHEHAYHRTLVTRQVPLGDPAHDGQNGDGRICASGEGCSPLRALAYPTWFITSGGAGAPYYSEMPTPWNRYWKKLSGVARPPEYFYSSQENLTIFQADRKKISMTVYNASGQVIDRINNLMAVRKRGN